MKFKKQLLLILLTNWAIFAQAQDLQFADMASLPGERSAISSANDGENIYVVNGFGKSAAYTSEIFKYNIASDSWTILTAMSSSKRFASAAIIDDKLYVFNGLLEGGILNDKVEVINLEDGAISFTTNHPLPSEAGGVSVWEGKIYSFGGSMEQAEISNKLYEFDPQTALWTALAEMPIAVETKGEIVDGKLYVFGGYNGMVSDRIDIYDIASNIWETGLTMPMGISAHSTAILGSRIYLVGDFANLTSMAYFETSDNSFQVVTSNLMDRRHCAAEGVQGQLYAIGGNTTSNIESSISSVQVADIISATNDFGLSQNIKIYPNPTSTILNLSTDFDFLRVLDIDGKQLAEYAGKINQIDVSDYKEGVYILIGKREDQWFRSKWVKMKD